MSDIPQGHGWWQATDGKFYPPESHPNFRPSPSLPQTSTAVLTPPPVQQSYTHVSAPKAHKRKKPMWRRWWAITIALLVALMVIVAVASPPEEEGSGQAANEAAPAPAADAPVDAPEPVVEPVEEPAPAETSLTPAQQNAVRSAESYLDLMGFSRQGLVDQLIFEQYSADDATIAVDSLVVDWNAEAAQSAASYLDTMAFSCGSLTDQLVFEKFTPEQAAFGAAQTGIC